MSTPEGTRHPKIQGESVQCRRDRNDKVPRVYLCRSKEARTLDLRTLEGGVRGETGEVGRAPSHGICGPQVRI